MTSKKRAEYRSLCNTMPAILLIGKEGVTENVIKNVDEALLARELIKCGLQKGAPVTAREACEEICNALHAEPIQCIGNKFCLFRQNEENSRFPFSE